MFNSVFLIISLIYVTDLCLLVPKYTRCKYDHTPRKKKLIWKGLCIVIPFLILVAGALILFLTGFADSDPLLVLLPVGMLLCAIGDIVIEIRFTKGGFLFGFGHLVYITAEILMLRTLHAVSIVSFLILAVMGLLMTIKFLGKKHRFLMVLYNTVISVSFSLGLGLVLQNVNGQVLVGFGIMSLCISDWLLARNKAFGSNYPMSLISLIFYFGGQIMISTYPYLIQ
ncbi:MAG: lysoplasmalogenase [Lachnospiraceae bacterium]|nr:lysoplasmalogenase [Lachnospiraceae bacterium]